MKIFRKKVKIKYSLQSWTYTNILKLKTSYIRENSALVHVFTANFRLAVQKLCRKLEYESEFT